MGHVLSKDTTRRIRCWARYPIHPMMGSLLSAERTRKRCWIDARDAGTAVAKTKGIVLSNAATVFWISCTSARGNPTPKPCPDPSRRPSRCRTRVNPNPIPPSHRYPSTSPYPALPTRVQVRFRVSRALRWETIARHPLPTVPRIPIRSRIRKVRHPT